MLKKFIEGSNVSILNSIYVRPEKQENGKWSKGCMYVIYKDLNTNKKYREEIEDPDMEYYTTKEGVVVQPRQLYLSKDDLDKHIVKYRNLEYDIAKVTDNEEFYKQNIYNGNRRANQRLHSDCVNLFSSDINIEDFYRFKFNNMYKNNPFVPTKGYFDIEVDIIDKVGDFPEMGECPVNAITYINQESKTVFTLLLRNSNNPLIQEFEDNLDNIYLDLHEFIKDRVGGDKGIEKYKLQDVKFKLLFYDEEIQLIADFFNLVNQLQPDFIMAWNMRFDLPYLYERILELGYNPLDIMIHKDFKWRYYYYYIDMNKEKKMQDSSDFCTMSSYSVWLDQMRQFACKRKAIAGSFKNWKLDYIGETTTGIGKLDYSHITRNIAKLPYLDYKTFVFYNIADVIVQYCIEQKSNDIDYILNKCLMNNTRYSKCHNQTIYLVNRATKEFYNKGFIISNNKNKFNKKSDEKYPGAHVANPRKINPYSKYKINGIPVLLFDNLDDFDYKAEYPSIINQFNISPNTQIGRIYIPTQVFAYENLYNLEHFDRTIRFIEDFHSHNYIEFCQRWFKLAGYQELCEDIMEYYDNEVQPMKVCRTTYDGKRRMLHYHNQKVKPKHMLKYVYKKPKLHRNAVIPQESFDLVNTINIDQIVYRESFDDMDEDETEE